MVCQRRRLTRRESIMRHTGIDEAIAWAWRTELTRAHSLITHIAPPPRCLDISRRHDVNDDVIISLSNTSPTRRRRYARARQFHFRPHRHGAHRIYYECFHEMTREILKKAWQRGWSARQIMLATDFINTFEATCLSRATSQPFSRKVLMRYTGTIQAISFSRKKRRCLAGRPIDWIAVMDALRIIDIILSSSSSDILFHDAKCLSSVLFMIACSDALRWYRYRDDYGAKIVIFNFTLPQHYSGHANMLLLMMR